MKQKERWVILISALMLIATLLFPPWYHYEGRIPFTYYTDSPVRTTHGYFFFFDTMQAEPNYRFLIFKIDWPRLLMLDLIIASVGATVVYALRSKRH
jgi:ABC-type Fe3+-siderophore transport system permease subunit